MAKVELIDIDSSSDDEPARTATGFNPESIDNTLNSFKSDVRGQESSASSEPRSSGLVSNIVEDSRKGGSVSIDLPAAQEKVGEEKEEDEDAKKHKYIDKLLNMHSHVCNRLATLDCYMDPLQRLKWQRQTTMSVPAINGKFPTNHVQNSAPCPINNRPRQQHSLDQDADWGGDSRPPWLINNGSSNRYRNAAPPRARKRTYKKKRTTRKATKQTARKSTSTWAPVARKSQPTTKAKQAAKATASNPSTSKVSTSSKAKKPEHTSSSQPKNTTASVKKVKKESVKKERVKGEPL